MTAAVTFGVVLLLGALATHAILRSFFRTFGHTGWFAAAIFPAGSVVAFVFAVMPPTFAQTESSTFVVSIAVTEAILVIDTIRFSLAAGRARAVRRQHEGGGPGVG